MALTDIQKKKLINQAPDKIAQCVLGGMVTLDELVAVGLDNQKKIYVENAIQNVPNPNEQREWAAIEPLLQNPSNDLIAKLNNYISNWQSSRPTGNHVDEAIEWISRIEENDWNAVDAFNVQSLYNYLLKYPNSVHKFEIDDSVWALIDKKNMQEVQNYLNKFPNGNHVSEAQKIQSYYHEWPMISTSRDLFVINDYIQNNPESPFLGEAQSIFYELKRIEIFNMQSNPNSCSVDRLMQMFDKKIFTDTELVYEGVLTPQILETLRNPEYLDNLPDINTALQNSIPECKDGYTDVYLFGVPSTGKTCVLMGLSGASSLDIKLASGGGDYAVALQQFVEAGMTVPSTPTESVATLEATMTSSINDNAIHKVNLVEMAGEQLVNDIANNPHKIFSFEDMGAGATELLKNDNRKVFFLIIDPTVNVVTRNREVVEYDIHTGEPSVRVERQVVNQQLIVKKMVDLFELEENAEIMKKVDSINIIMTKADTLGSEIEREDKAMQIFNSKYRDRILRNLIEIGKKYEINAPTNYRPKLFTFSLGKFYVGGLYEYDQTDSDLLVNAIRNSTRGYKKESFLDKVKKVLNNPIF